MERQRVIVITGPTASGKSALALALAEKRRGTVINADAMQTYDAFPVLTAQPTPEERARAAHALYGVLPLSQTLSAARWRTLAIPEIERGLAGGGAAVPFAHPHTLPSAMAMTPARMLRKIVLLFGICIQLAGGIPVFALDGLFQLGCFLAVVIGVVRNAQPAFHTGRPLIGPQ